MSFLATASLQQSGYGDVMKRYWIFCFLSLSSIVEAQQVPPSIQGASISAARAMDIKDAINGDWRSDASKARDIYRHPEQTLAFFGIKPEMTVLEITPGAGWYTEILAPALQHAGRYVAAVQNDPDEDDKRAAQKWYDELAADPQHFGMVGIVHFDRSAPDFGSSGSMDAVLTFRNVHNWESIGTTKAMFHAFFDVLKPGGVLGVVDHRAKSGSDPRKSAEGGYLPEAYVVKVATDEGFVLDAKSEINANPKDTKDYPIGVWALPPTLGMGKIDREKLISIGESDRMTLRFIKPTKKVSFCCRHILWDAVKTRSSVEAVHTQTRQSRSKVYAACGVRFAWNCSSSVEPFNAVVDD